MKIGIPLLILIMMSLSSCLKNEGGGAVRKLFKPLIGDQQLSSLLYSKEIRPLLLGEMNPMSESLIAQEVQQEGQDLSFEFTFNSGENKAMKVLDLKPEYTCTNGIMPRFSYLLYKTDTQRELITENLNESENYAIEENTNYLVQVLAHAEGCENVAINLSVWVGFEGVTPLVGKECIFESEKRTFQGSQFYRNAVFEVYDQKLSLFISDDSWCGESLGEERGSFSISRGVNLEEVLASFELEERKLGLSYSFRADSQKGELVCVAGDEVVEQFEIFNCRNKIYDSSIFQ